MEYKLGHRVVFADREPDVHKPTFNEAGLVTGIINGDVIEHGGLTYVPVYVSATDRVVAVDSRNIVDVKPLRGDQGDV